MDAKRIYVSKSFGLGCDLQKFNLENIPAETQLRFHRRLSVRPEDFVFIFVGRQVDFKGFDRLIRAFLKLYEDHKNFPNQDFHSGKGLGNLIALPFHKPSLENGNSCFLDIDTFQPFTNQWEFLESIQRASSKIFDELYESITIQQPIHSVKTSPSYECTK